MDNMHDFTCGMKLVVAVCTLATAHVRCIETCCGVSNDFDTVPRMRQELMQCSSTCTCSSTLCVRQKQVCQCSVTELQ